MPDTPFWFGKRVLVTGGDGFVAAHLIKALIEAGALVVSAVRGRHSVSRQELIHSSPGRDLADGPDIEYCDLLDFEAVRIMCDRHQIDTIFHLAASAIVSNASRSPVSTVKNNVLATLNILDVARGNQIPRVLITSTDKVYGDHADDPFERLPYQEDYALRGMDVYSASKVCADMLAQTYAYQFKLPVIVVRSCNIYGTGDLNFTRLIPRTIMCLLGNRPPIIDSGNEDVLREYIYVTDVVRAYMFLMEKSHDIYGEDFRNMPKRGRQTYGWAAYNVGSYMADDLRERSRCGNIKSVRAIVDILRRQIMDIEPTWKERRANYIEIPDQYLDSSKLLGLGYRPTVDFEIGLRETIEWYKKSYALLEKQAFMYMGV